MKKCSALFILCLLMTSTLSAWDVFLEGKASYFYPEHERFRENIEGSGMYGAEISSEYNNCFGVWASADYFYAKGKKKFHRSNRITILPIAAGVKYYVPVSSSRFYLGGGFSSALVQIENDTDYARKHSHSWNWAAIGKSGVILPIRCDLFLDFFLNYSVQLNSVQEKNKGVFRYGSDISAWVFGVGFGWHLGPYADNNCYNKNKLCSTNEWY